MSQQSVSQRSRSRLRMNKWNLKKGRMYPRMQSSMHFHSLVKKYVPETVVILLSVCMYTPCYLY